MEARGEAPAKEICRCRGVFEEGKEDVMMTVWNPRRIQGAVGDGGGNGGGGWLKSQ
jgi:hypothetical protein